MATQNLGNVMTRLGGLKNVNRRVMPGAEFLQQLEEPDTDVSGTAQPLPNFANFQSPTQNMPEEDFGGELTPQSYDVRANVVNAPEEQEPGFFSKLGQALADYVNPQKRQEMSEQNAAMFNRGQPAPQPTPPPAPQMEQAPIPPSAPPIATEQVDISEGLPPETPSQEMAMETPEMAPPEAPAPEPKEAPEPEAKEPGTYVELGAAQKVYDDPKSSPELKSEIERIFDTKLTPERTKEVKEFETAVGAFMNKLEGVETALTTREKALMAKIENRDLSASEQISMALALIAPALIGGLLAGKQGFAHGLAGGGANVANALGGRMKDIKEAEELLPEIALEKSKIGKEKLATTQQAAELKRKIQESVPNHALKELFTKDGMILNGKLVLNTGNPLLPLKSTAVRNAEDLKTFREKKMPELAEKVSTTEQGLHLLDNLQELLDYSAKEKSGLQYDYLPFYDTTATAFKALVPAGRDTFKDEDGNEVKISELYETVLEQLSDMYSQAVGAAGSKTAFKTYREHFREMLPNPFTAAALAKGRTQTGTITSQIKSVKDKFEDNIIKKLDSAGVETGPIKELFSATKINTNRSEKKRKTNRADEAVKEVLGQ
jgi:hypothetical protein